ncbi:MAG: hypothetical protein IJE08_11850 [Clostridia bacterium]|nr:hypothetical protein [Clostridia bacterium]
MNARRIDNALLWSFASVSALFYTLVMTGGRLLLSVFLTLICMFSVVILSRRLPDSRKPSRKEKAACAKSMLRKWILSDERTVLNTIRQHLPDLIPDSDHTHVHLVLRMPDTGLLSSDDLLAIWRSNIGKDHIVLLATCPADAAAITLCSELIAPTVRIIDGIQLVRHLADSLSYIPEDTKKEQRVPLRSRIALFAKGIHPFRAAAYAFALIVGYILTGRSFYLASGALLAALLIVHSVSRKQSAIN